MNIKGVIEKIKAQDIRVLIGGLAALVIIVGGMSYYAATRAADPQASAQKETERIVALVGRLLVLPADETPVVATVADPSKLQGQAFFQNAKTGDKLLIYNTAKKAILYDPVADRIVEVAPLSVGSQTPAVPTP